MLTCEIFLSISFAASRLDLRQGRYEIATGQGIGLWALTALLEQFAHGVLGWDRPFDLYTHLRMTLYIAPLDVLGSSDLATRATASTCLSGDAALSRCPTRASSIRSGDAQPLGHAPMFRSHVNKWLWASIALLLSTALLSHFVQAARLLRTEQVVRRFWMPIYLLVPLIWIALHEVLR